MADEKGSNYPFVHAVYVAVVLIVIALSITWYEVERPRLRHPPPPKKGWFTD